MLSSLAVPQRHLLRAIPRSSLPELPMNLLIEIKVSRSPEGLYTSVCNRSLVQNYAVCLNDPSLPNTPQIPRCFCRRGLTPCRLCIALYTAPGSFSLRQRLNKRLIYRRPAKEITNSGDTRSRDIHIEPVQASGLSLLKMRFQLMLGSHLFIDEARLSDSVCRCLSQHSMLTNIRRFDGIGRALHETGPACCAVVKA